MGKSPRNTEGHRHMCDVAMARSYVADIGGNGSVKTVLAKAYETLARMFPHRENPRNQWTERRVRAFWHKEAAFVEFREMVELHKAAETAKAERDLLQQARKEHAAFIEKTAALRALFEHQNQDIPGAKPEGLRRIAGGMDRPGVEG